MKLKNDEDISTGGKFPSFQMSKIIVDFLGSRYIFYRQGNI